MLRNTTNSRVVWMKRDSAGNPDAQEKVIDGSFDSAVSFATSLATEPDFLMGQILASDGLVLANVAPGRTPRMNRPQ